MSIIKTFISVEHEGSFTGSPKGSIVTSSGSTETIFLPVGNDGQILVADSSTATGLKWGTASGGTSSAETFTNTGATPNTVGGIAAGTTFSAKTNAQMWNLLLYPELFPTLTAPSNTFTLTQSGFQIIGSTVATLNFSAGFSRGSISPAYGTSGYRSGLPTIYNYTGTGLPATVSSNATTDIQTVSSYVVLTGAQSWTCGVSYSGGEQPLSNLGNPYNTALASGTTGAITRTITGVYPYFATTSVISTLTQQTLVANSSQVAPAMVAESGGYKQTIEFPTTWAPIIRLEQYNTLSGAWDVIDLNAFGISAITKTIAGNSVNYKQYYHSGATIGARSLRFSTV